MIKKYEKQILEVYLNLPNRKLLNNQFELEEDFLAGLVSRFLKGERFQEEIIPFSKNELDVISSLLNSNINNPDGKDLLTAFLLTKVVCNIMNKYKK